MASVPPFLLEFTVKTIPALLAALALAGTARAETPDTDAQAALLLATARRVATVERDLAEVKSRLAALEAQPRAAQPAPAATLPAAPAYEVVSYDYGRTWVTRQVPGTSAAPPAFATPVRSAAYQMFAPRSACANGQCPR